MSIEIEQFKQRVNNDLVFAHYFGPGQTKRNVSCFNHSDRVPSMSIDTKLGLYYCHGCHISGDVIQLVMERESVGFLDAVMFISRLLNIEPPFSSGDKHVYTPDALTVSMGFYQQHLKASHLASQYLEGRGINGQTIRELGIGYAPYDSRIYKELIAANPEVDFSAMLNDFGSPKLCGRITFPLFSRYGVVDNFIGRSLRGEPPKYYKVLNQEHLYGVNTLYKGKGPVIVVEGPMDMAAMYQNGLRSVALLGTGMIKRENVSLLKSYGKKVYMALDPDESGMAATLKGMRIMYKCGFMPFVVPLVEDPDVTISKEGKEAFVSRLETAKSGAEWIAQKYKGMDAVDLLMSTVMVSPDSMIRSIEKKTFVDISGIDIKDMSKTRETDEYRTFILSSAKLYDDLYKKILLGPWPDWIKDELINSPPINDTNLIATHKEVEIGLNRLLHPSS